LDLLAEQFRDLGQIRMLVALVQAKRTDTQAARPFAEIQPHPARRCLLQTQHLKGTEVAPFEHVRERTLRTVVRHTDRERPVYSTDAQFHAIERPHTAQIDGEHPTLRDGGEGDSPLADRPLAQEIVGLAFAGQFGFGGDTRSELGGNIIHRIRFGRGAQRA